MGVGSENAGTLFVASYGYTWNRIMTRRDDYTIRIDIKNNGQ